MLFSERLRNLRKQKNLSQKEFAALLHINPVTLSHYENEKREPDLERLASLCKELRVSSDYLLGLTDIQDPKLTSQSSLSGLLNATKNALSVTLPSDPFEGLSESDRANILSIIDSLKRKGESFEEDPSTTHAQEA